MSFVCSNPCPVSSPLAGRVREGLEPIEQDSNLSAPPLFPPRAGGMFASAITCLTVIFLLFSFPSLAAEPDADKGAASGLALPRFASLRSDEANMRTGPGTRYPIEWVYKHKALPMEIVGEFEIWRRVRDPEGVEGWVHKSELSGKRMAIVTGATRNLLDDSGNNAAVVAHLEIGSSGQILSCSKEWCRLKFDGIKGYLRKSEFWGAYPNETFN